MLPAAARLRRRDEFVTALRRGRRRTDGSRPAHIVTYVAVHPGDPAGPAAAARPTSAGFIVSRTVGSAVVRNRVRRRLRHLMAVRLPELPAGLLVVVRALPASAAASSADLSAALDRALTAELSPSASAERRDRR